MHKLSTIVLGFCWQKPLSQTLGLNQYALRKSTSGRLPTETCFGQDGLFIWFKLWFKLLMAEAFQPGAIYVVE